MTALLDSLLHEKELRRLVADGIGELACLIAHRNVYDSGDRPRYRRVLYFLNTGDNAYLEEQDR